MVHGYTGKFKRQTEGKRKKKKKTLKKFQRAFLIFKNIYSFKSS